MADLEELLKRLEAATGPDRELDRDLGMAIGGWRYVPGRDAFLDNNDRAIMDGDGNTFPDSPGAEYTSFTSSIDAALALVERKLPDHKWGLHELQPGVYRAHVTKRSPLRPMPNIADMPTAPLAILIALLKALQADTSNDK